jgi:hypothetical protein
MPRRFGSGYVIKRDIKFSYCVTFLNDDHITPTNNVQLQLLLLTAQYSAEIIIEKAGGGEGGSQKTNKKVRPAQ